jgi:hypothetical protein
LTVTGVPPDGSVPAENPSVKTSFVTVADKDGSVPADPNGVTEAVEPAVFTLIDGAETLPAGVYVAVPLVGDTVAVLFSVVLVDTETEPSGVMLPDAEQDPFEKVGCDTDPAGV